MIRYFDASALAKRYIGEPESKKVGRLLSACIAVTCRLTEAEIASALARRRREGVLTEAVRDRLLAYMRRDMASLYVVELSPEVSDIACHLLMRHMLRAGDALQLASALAISGRSGHKVQFVAFDQALNEAALKEGFELP